MKSLNNRNSQQIPKPTLGTRAALPRAFIETGTGGTSRKSRTGPGFLFLGPEPAPGEERGGNGWESRGGRGGGEEGKWLPAVCTGIQRF